MNRIIGIDPGENCGMVILDGGEISSVFNIMSDQIWSKIQYFLLQPNTTVVIEDIRPYSLRLTPQVIETCKWIGEAVYRLKNGSGAIVELMSRSEVKKWCFDTFPEVCRPLADKKIAKKGYKNKETGEFRKATFVYVDDKIVTECMKELHKIPLPKSGKGYQFGLKSHSFQALAVASRYHAKLVNV
jgi:hypothetical protein